MKITSFLLTMTVVTLHTLLVSSVIQAGAYHSDCKIIDLSKDLLLSENFNSNNASNHMLNITKSKYSQILSYVVLVDGLKTAEYYNVEQGVNEDSLHHAFSVAKSWVSLLIGILVSMGSLSLHETLSNIWPDTLTDVWSDIHEASYRKNITVEELLTMTLGCQDPPNVFERFYSTFGTGKFGGWNLTSTLNYPDCSNKTSKTLFSYLNDNILSYIILKRSGLTPQDFATKNLWPFLGILDKTWKWQMNLDGVAYASAGFSTTTVNFAKFGQLYLQNGFASGSKQLVPLSWIKKSTEIHVKLLPDDPIRMAIFSNSNASVGYGYRFWVISSDKQDLYCAIGAFGHKICIWPELGRVLVVNVAEGEMSYTSNWLGHEYVEMVGDLQFS